jgi:hypothetical protein
MNRRLLVWIVPAVFTLGYPLVVLGGGGPRFPSRSECVHPATSDGRIEAVFGRFETSAAADSAQRRAAQAGFKNLQIESDGCGLLKVTLPGIPSLEVGRDFVAEAQKVGFHPMLEQQAP